MRGLLQRCYRVLIWIPIFISLCFLARCYRAERRSERLQVREVRGETERQVEELRELLLRVQETSEHSQIWWRTMELLKVAREEEARWREVAGDGKFEDTMAAESRRRVEMLEEFLKP